VGLLKGKVITMRILITEDDFVSRLLLQRLLEPWGTCDVTVNGAEAVEAFTRALDAKKPYDLVCLDIMMPVMDGQAALAEIRQIEAKHGIWGLQATKILMTTALDDSKTVLSSFRSQCEIYMVKPINEHELYRNLRALGFTPEMKSQTHPHGHPITT
jgi:two-component system chemotaxis response regulator CheY